MDSKRHRKYISQFKETQRKPKNVGNLHKISLKQLLKESCGKFGLKRVK